MNPSAKIKPTHLSRNAYVYVRQSTDYQVQNNLQSQQRQYELADLAVHNGWPRESVVTIDEDLGRSGSSAAGRTGFGRLVSEVALGKAGIVYGLEVSRLARNNRDWYQLLDLCSMTLTLIADADGVYDPACFNDRLLLGLKGTMSEAELHVLRGRMQAGMQHKASKGELKFSLPAGFTFDDEGRIIKSVDEQIQHIIGLVFSKFIEIGTVSGVLKLLLEEGLQFPRKAAFDKSIRWVRPYYKALYDTLTNPLYAGTYVFGRSKMIKELDEHGNARSRQKKQAMKDWPVVIHDHHAAYVSWEEFLKVSTMIGKNRPAVKDQPGGAVREGNALLQGLAWCGQCGRSMRTRYHSTGKVPYPYYVCNAAMGFGGSMCQSVGGRRIDEAIVSHFLEQMAPASMEIQMEAMRRMQEQEDDVETQLQLELERARYQAERMARQYNAIEPENRLVARTLESQWNEALEHVQEVEQKLAERRRQRALSFGDAEREQIKRLAEDLPALWNAPTTTDKDRKQLLRAVLEKVQITKHGNEVDLKIIWKGGAVVDKHVQLPKTPTRPTPNADVVELVRTLAQRHTDAQIARVLILKGFKTLKGLSFNAHRVANLRLNHDIPCYRASNDSTESRFTVDAAAELLQVSRNTIYLWLKAGLLKGDQLTESAPWTVYVNDEDKRRLNAAAAPSGWLSLEDAARECGVSKQAVLNWVKQGKVPFVYITKGRRRGLRIDVNSTSYKAQAVLFS
jgi:DNA invertase Pin-like site-specific DNA recombinase